MSVTKLKYADWEYQYYDNDKMCLVDDEHNMYTTSFNNFLLGKNEIYLEKVFKDAIKNSNDYIIPYEAYIIIKTDSGEEIRQLVDYNEFFGYEAEIFKSKSFYVKHINDVLVHPKTGYEFFAISNSEIISSDDFAFCDWFFMLCLNKDGDFVCIITDCFLDSCNPLSILQCRDAKFRVLSKFNDSIEYCRKMIEN